MHVQIPTAPLATLSHKRFSLALAVTVQFALGETDQRALHIFLGVLVVMLGTALTSWTYRHEMPSRR